MTTKIEITTEEAHTGQRLDKLLSAHCGTLSRSRVQKLIANNHLTIDGRIVTDCSYQVKPYEQLSLALDVQIEREYAAPAGKNIPLNIFYEDEHLLVINKDAGLTVHPGAGTHDDTMVNGLIFHFGDKLSQMGGIDRPGIVHRLDRDTTGLMIIAKNDICHAKLSSMMQERLINREYVALVYGVPYPLVGKIETHIARNPALRTAMRVVRDSGKWALTNYKVEELLAERTISKVICKLETGRTHQIRVHMLHKKNPVIGDPIYGRSMNHNLNALSDLQRAAVREFSRQALHAQNLSFIHPITEEEMDFHAPMPEDMMNLYNILAQK